MFMSLVVPAYNEENRIGIMLAEAVEYLQQEYGNSSAISSSNGTTKRRKEKKGEIPDGPTPRPSPDDFTSSVPTGWEILIVSDGSTDQTTETTLSFARDLGPDLSPNIRVIALQKNRGKGGAVTHGMRHVRGQYALFADADGASRFADLGKLLQEARKVQDHRGRAVAVGSRAHLVGSEAVVKVRLQASYPSSLQTNPSPPIKNSVLGYWQIHFQR